MFPDFDEDLHISDLPSWGLPGYDRVMAKTSSTGKAAAGKTAKRKTTGTKRKTAK